MSERRRTMIITGGAGNNGLAIIRKALESGMNVAFMSGWHSKAQNAIKKLDPVYLERKQVLGFAQNPQAQLEMNMRDAPELYRKDTTQEDVLRWIADYFGGIDVVVNGSGGHIRKNFDETDYAIWRHSVEITEAAFFNTKMAMQYLEKARSPRVINLTTFDGKGRGYFSDPAFAAARGGIVSLTYEMARELGPKGITVNCVLTGHIEGDVPAEDTLTETERAAMIAATPLGRLGVPEDVAGIVNFLAGEDSGFITGAVIDVNGGISMGA